MIKLSVTFTYNSSFNGKTKTPVWFLIKNCALYLPTTFVSRGVN